MSRDELSLAHTVWNCKYHIVFAPKYRRKVFSNNISSMYYARDIIDRCYVCEADLVITKYQYCSNYLGAYVSETDDWCFFKKVNILIGLLSAAKTAGI